MKEYTVYIHKNLKNEKYYVGSTKMNPKRRWNNGLGYQKQPKMWSDIQNSDWNSDWCHGILGKFDNKQDALKYEAFLIAMLDSVENGYNTSAFDNYKYKRTEESKKKMSESMKGKIYGEVRLKPVLQFSKTGELIAEYPSLMEAERRTGCHSQSICKCCKGTRKTCGGYVWRYAS